MIFNSDEAFVADLWINPRTGEDVTRCPWLRKVRGKNIYACRIHDTKPRHCHEFPWSREIAQKIGCKWYDKL
ncbi:MAG: hypothetical protein JXR73_02185 [Candidatus Omnitrophica bacterium]|nr:hypothetical protein [Candidatus Omnitrophota bacterium]